MEIRSPLVIDSDSICIFQAQNTIDKMFPKFRRLPRLSAPLPPHTGLPALLANKIPAWPVRPDHQSSLAPTPPKARFPLHLRYL